jgi:hypothetical protein
MKKSWFEPYLTSLLVDRTDTLDSWRRQIPALSGRTKNFENWLLVELVDRVSRSGKIRAVRTNGHFSDAKIKASEVDGLSGRKSEAVHLSPDISIRLKKEDRSVSSEIKTGLAPKEIFNDIKIVKHYKKKEVCNHAEFIWVVLLPDGDIERRSSGKSFEKIFHRMQQDYPEIFFVQKEITPWLILVVGVID